MFDELAGAGQLTTRKAVWRVPGKVLVEDLIAILLTVSKACTTIVLRSAATLLISHVLASARSEQTCGASAIW
jgi:hypothetical protein